MDDVLVKEEKKMKGFLMIENEFLRAWVKEVRIGPAMIYLQLLGYCYGDKDLAYPSLKTLAYRMGVSIKTIVVYRKILVSYGLIKRIIRRKDANGSYQTTLYQLVRFDKSQLSEKDVDEDEEVVSEIIDANKEVKQKFNESIVKKEDSLFRQLRELGISQKYFQKLLQAYPKNRIKSKLYLFTEKNIHNPGAYLLSILRNRYFKIEDMQESESEEKITSDEMNELNPNESLARKIYYQKLDRNALPRSESLEWIRRIQGQMKDGKMSCFIT